MELSVCTVGIIAFMSSGLINEGAISADMLKGLVCTPTHGKFSSSLDVRSMKSRASHLPPTCLIRADKVEEPEVVMPTDAELKKMTKVQLETFARGLGVELDKRKTKANMIADLKSQS